MTDNASLATETNDVEIQINEHLAGKYVYGRIFWGRFPFMKEHLLKTEMDRLMMEMTKLGYTGPRTIREIKKDAQYPVEFLSIYNQAFVNLFGEKRFEEMARESAKKKGIVSTMARWAGTPEKVLDKIPDSWKKFYAFGKLETEITGENKGIIRILDGKVDKLFCKYLTNYFGGIGGVIDYELAVEHTKCVFEGDDYSEWEISWGKDTTSEVEEEISKPSTEMNVMAIPESPPKKDNSGFTSEEIFNIVVTGLEGELGDILARGITNKALGKIGTSKDRVTEDEMKKALHTHVKPSLLVFMTPDKANDCVRAIVKKFVGSGLNV